MSNVTKPKMPDIQLMAKIALLSAIAFVLSIEGLFRFRIPMLFPEFLAMDISDVPAVIGAITLGPIAGAWILGLGNVLTMVITGSISMGIGPLANFIFGVAYILPLCYFYNRYGKNTKSFALGAIVGTVMSTAMAGLLNYFMVIPAFAFAMDVDLDAIVRIGSNTNEGINSLMTLVLFGIVPFNLAKNVLVSIVGFALYKAFKPVLNVIFKKRV